MFQYDIVNRIAVGMSGGVDSSVAAALLVKDGQDCVGMTMKLWNHKSSRCEDKGNLCCSLESVEAARRVARKLEIDYFVINVEEKFKKEVVDDFVDAYARGVTPNPCVICNEKIKFAHFDEKASLLNADLIATGHYARTCEDPSGRVLLLKGKDKWKDQSYMLYRLSQDQLRRAIFPLGNLTKDEVRGLAHDFSLDVADKPDSQEVCFVPYDDYRVFITEYRPELGVNGDITDEYGNVLGRHNGIAMYTIGQRKGLGSLGERPMYVVDILPDENRVVAGYVESTYSNTFYAKNLNFMPFDELNQSITVEVKVRYRSSPQKATIIPIENDVIKVELAEPCSAVTPGQSVVFYDGEIVVGGGIIFKN